MYVSMCTCVYICMTCLCIYIYVSVSIDIYVSLSIYVYICNQAHGRDNKASRTTSRTMLQRAPNTQHQHGAQPVV